MWTELCRHRAVPDIDLFINKRDFPLLRFDQQEAYDDIAIPPPGPSTSTSTTTTTTHREQLDSTAPVMHGPDPPNDTNLAHFIPILSMTSTPEHADIPIPTWEDWSRIASIDDGKFFSKPIRDYNYKFQHDWSKKQPTAIFRGASTGIGTTADTNMRLKIAKISHQLNNLEFLDAGITKWNLRPRLHAEKSKIVNEIDWTQIHLIFP